MLTGRQIREARFLLGWSYGTVSRRAEVTDEIVRRAEQTDHIPSITLFHATRLQAAFEKAGVDFGHGGGVMMGSAREKL